MATLPIDLYHLVIIPQNILSIRPRISQTSRVKATLRPSYRAICTNLKDDIRWGRKVLCGSLIADLLHDMIGDDHKGMVTYHVNFSHLTTVSRDARFTCCPCNCLNRYKGILKKEGIAIWASCYGNRWMGISLRPSWLAGPLTRILF